MKLAARNRMVEENYWLVQRIAWLMKERLPASVDVDDLISEGTFGLMDAVEKFDPKRNVKFVTYASTRIRGSILDYLRKLNWTPRHLNARIRKLEEATRQLQQELERQPVTDEVARRMKVSTDEVRSLQVDQVVSSVPDEVRDIGTELVLIREDRRVVPPPQVASYRDLVRNGLKYCSIRDQQIAVMYFVEGWKLHDVGRILGLSESRCCQLLHRISRTLRVRVPA